MSVSGNEDEYLPQQEHPDELDDHFANTKTMNLVGFIHKICSLEDWHPTETEEIALNLQPTVQQLMMARESAERLKKRAYKFLRQTRNGRNYERMIKRDGFARVMRGGPSGLMRIMKGEDEGDEEPRLQAHKKNDGANNHFYRTSLEDMHPKKYFVQTAKRDKYMIRVARSKSKNYLHRAVRDAHHIRMSREVPGQKFYPKSA